MPASLVNAIEGTRDEIQRIKASLREFGVVVDELPDEQFGESDS